MCGRGTEARWLLGVGVQGQQGGERSETEHLVGEAGQIGQAEAEDSDIAGGEMSGRGRGRRLGRRGSLVGVERRRGFPGGRDRGFRGEWTQEGVEAGAGPGLFLNHSGRRGSMADGGDGRRWGRRGA
jgi:hypothetical protein